MYKVLKSFHRRKHEENTVDFREIIPTGGTNILFTFHVCFHFDFHNISDLFEIIENRKYNISETVRMGK